MTKPWDLVEDEARRLLSNGMSLERLRKELSRKRGFDASTRAWRNKISEWGIKKQRPKENQARSTCSHCGFEPHRTEGGSSTPTERTSFGQDAYRDQTVLDGNAGQPSAWNDETNGSPVELSDVGPPQDDVSIAAPNSMLLVHGNAGSIKPPAGPLLERKSNEEIYGRLLDLAERRTETEEEYDAILDEATFIDGEESILHFMARQQGMYADWRAWDRLIPYMLDHGHSLKLLDSARQTALEIGIKANNSRAITFLCEENPSLANVDHGEGSLLHVAIRYSSTHLCTRLIGHIKDINRKDHVGNTPLQLAAQYGHDELVRELLDKGARIHDQRALVDSILWPRLDIKSSCDLLERGFLKHKEPHEINSSCRDIVKIVSIEGWESDRMARFISLLGHICRTYPAFLSDCDDDDKDWIFGTVQRFVSLLYEEGNLQQSVTNAYNVSLRLFLRVGFRVDTNGRFPYTGTRFKDLPGIATYTYVRACVETCDVETLGHDLWRLIKKLLGKQADSDEDVFEDGEGDGFALWTKRGESKLIDLLQTLVDRGLQLPHGSSLLGFVLDSIPNRRMEQKVRLLKSILRTQMHTPIVAYYMDGRPLDLLARTPEPSRWRYAEVLLNEGTLIRLLETKFPIERLESIASPDTTWKSTFSAYTSCPHELRRCVLHVLTRNDLHKFFVGFHARLDRISQIRRSFELPDLQFRMNNDGQLSLIDDDEATASTDEATEPVDPEEIIGHS